MNAESRLTRFFHRFRDVDARKLHPLLQAKLKSYQVATYLLAAAIFLPLIYLRLWSLPVYIVMGIYGYRRRKRLGPELDRELSPYRNTKELMPVRK